MHSVNVYGTTVRCINGFRENIFDCERNLPESANTISNQIFGPTYVGKSVAKAKLTYLTPGKTNVGLRVLIDMQLI